MPNCRACDCAFIQTIYTGADSALCAACLAMGADAGTDSRDLAPPEPYQPPDPRLAATSDAPLSEILGADTWQLPDGAAERIAKVPDVYPPSPVEAALLAEMDRMIKEVSPLRGDLLAEDVARIGGPPIHPADLCDMLPEGCTLRIGHAGICVPDHAQLEAQRAMTVARTCPAYADALNDRGVRPRCAMMLNHGGQHESEDGLRWGGASEALARIVEDEATAELAARKIEQRGPAFMGLAKLARGLDAKQLEAATDLLREILGGATRVVVVGERVNDRRNDPRPSEPGHAELVDAGIYNPAARSVYGMEPAHTGEANEFGEGGSVQGYTEKERRAAYRAFLGVRSTVREMLDAPDPATFFAKLGKAVAYVDPSGAAKLAGMVERFTQPQIAENAPLGALPDIDVDVEPEIGGES